MYTLLLLFILASMTAFMLLVFGVFMAAFLRILGGFSATHAPPPAELPSNPAGPTWTIKYKEDKKTKTLVISADSEADAIKLIMKMGIRFDSISHLTRN